MTTAKTILEHYLLECGAQNVHSYNFGTTVSFTFEGRDYVALTSDTGLLCLYIADHQGEESDSEPVLDEVDLETLKKFLKGY